MKRVLLVLIAIGFLLGSIFFVHEGKIALALLYFVITLFYGAQLAESKTNEDTPMTTQPNQIPTLEEQSAAFVAWRKGEPNVEYWSESDEEWMPMHSYYVLAISTIIRIRP